jgi:hypothetical protein
MPIYVGLKSRNCVIQRRKTGQEKQDKKQKEAMEEQPPSIA